MATSKAGAQIPCRLKPGPSITYPTAAMYEHPKNRKLRYNTSCIKRTPEAILKLKYRFKTKQYKVYTLQFSFYVKESRTWICSIIFKPIF